MINQAYQGMLLAIVRGESDLARDFAEVLAHCTFVMVPDLREICK